MNTKSNIKFTIVLFAISLVIRTGYSQEKINILIGDWKSEDGQTFAQLYKTPEGIFKINIVEDLTSRVTPRVILESEDLKDGSVFTGSGWTATITKNLLVLKNPENSFQFSKFERKSPTLKASPPNGAIVLFNGNDLDSWKRVEGKDWLKGSGPADHWKILPEGVLEVVPRASGISQSIITRKKFGDLKLHLEFRLLGEKTNGGIYLMSRYEINIKDAYGHVLESPIGFGNISDPKDLYPKENVAFPPGQWQTLDIEFKAPKFDSSGKIKIANARISVIHNGLKIYDDVELLQVKGSTSRLGEAAIGPIYLQEHGAPYQFRNIWVIDQTTQEDRDIASIQNQNSDISEESMDKKSGGKKGGKENKDKSVRENAEKSSREKSNATENKGGKKTDDKTEATEKKGKKGKKSDASYQGELNPLYSATTVQITAKSSTEPATPAGFQHPGILVNLRQLQEIKRRVENKMEPQYSAFLELKNSPFGSLDYEATPRETVSCGPYSNPNLGCKDEQKDCAAAYSQALLWFITGEKAYAEKAISIMNDWSSTLKGGHNYANGPVQSAWAGSVWPRAAEIIRYTYNGWTPGDVAQFQNMLRTQYLPTVIHGDCENGNKELAMSEAIVNMGVFLDDPEVFNLGLKMWRGRTPAYIYLTSDGEEPIQPPGCPPAYWSNKGLMPELVDGILQETARDSHHHGMAFASMANAAETARQQGIDLYGEEQERIMASMEYVAQYLPPNNVPVPENLNFELLKTWEIAFNHYYNRQGKELPNMKKIIPTNRPTGVDHHMVWETLTHGNMGTIGLPPLKGSDLMGVVE